MSAPYSTASATTWAMAPGLAPSSAESGSQPWTSRKYHVAATIEHSVDTVRSATLSGQVVIPVSVSGVTTAPSSMPISMKHRRASHSGILVGRPASAAHATASTDPETSPAGTPIRLKPTPPAPATASVSATCRNSWRLGGRGSIFVILDFLVGLLVHFLGARPVSGGIR